MTTFLIIVLAILCLLALVSLIRGIVAFMKSTKIDLEKGEAENVPEMQMLQNKMMFNRIKYQALAIVVVAILLALSR
jgi:Na+-transporting methylmalonyl-CoA/oxaloacetate decarboxylase gamma subunit